MTHKAIIFPFEVPWAIASDLCYFELENDAQGKPKSLTFTAYIRDHESSNTAASGEAVLVIDNDIEAYRPAKVDERAPYHRVRIKFAGGQATRRILKYNGSTYFDPAFFDMSNYLFADLALNETLEEHIDKAHKYQTNTGFSAMPGCFEVKDSNWIKEDFPDVPNLKHFIFINEVEEPMNLEVLAKDWSWELGQATS